MKTIARLRRQLSRGEFDFSRHALQRVVERRISDQEIREAGAEAVVVEDYPHDKYSCSCLLLGFTGAGRPLHVQVSRVDTALVRIVTIYQPTVAEWIGYVRRR